MTPRGCPHPALQPAPRSVLRGQTIRRRRTPAPGAQPATGPRRKRFPRLHLISGWLPREQPLHVCDELARLVHPRPDLGLLKFDEVRVVSFATVVEEPVV